jgi:hypothetical protein
MSAKTSTPTAHVRLHSVQAPERVGGETRPYEYPHLYQIQAGDWRISYAVEQNHLAILVLEVLNPDGTVAEDPVRETLNRKMKIKLLDWPDGSPSRDLRPEDLGRKVKIRLLDMAEDAASDRPGGAPRPARIKLPRDDAQRARPSVLLDPPQNTNQSSPEPTDRRADLDQSDRKVTPLDSPTM